MSIYSQVILYHMTLDRKYIKDNIPESIIKIIIDEYNECCNEYDYLFLPNNINNNYDFIKEATREIDEYEKQNRNIPKYLFKPTHNILQNGFIFIKN